MSKSKPHLKRRMETKKKMEKRQPHGRQLAPAVLPGVSAESLKPVVCKCGGVLFAPVFAVKMASPLQTVNGQPAAIQFPLGFYCLKCQQMNQIKEDTDDTKVSEPEAGNGGDLGVSVAEKVKSGEALG